MEGALTADLTMNIKLVGSISSISTSYKPSPALTRGKCKLLSENEGANLGLGIAGSSPEIT